MSASGYRIDHYWQDDSKDSDTYPAHDIGEYTLHFNLGDDAEEERGDYPTSEYQRYRET
jgi:hypothetical protein